MQDLHNQIKCTMAEPPIASQTDDTAYISAIIDTANFGSTEFVVTTGSIADANVTFTILFEDGNNSALSDNAAVVDAQLFGTESPSFLFSDDNSTYKIGYNGAKRYCRVTITPSGNSGALFLSALWIQGHPRKGPQSTQII